MAISEAYTGSATISTTEWSLTTNTAGPDVDTNDGIYQFFVDLNALAAGDVFECRMYEKATSAGTQRLVYSCRFAGAQGAPVWASPSFILLHGWDVTLRKIIGTDRSLAWSIRKVA
jgi:hypothetical protein